jgi:hypothetical protein
MCCYLPFGKCFSPQITQINTDYFYVFLVIIFGFVMCCYLPCVKCVNPRITRIATDFFSV